MATAQRSGSETETVEKTVVENTTVEDAKVEEPGVEDEGQETTDNTDELTDESLADSEEDPEEKDDTEKVEVLTAEAARKLRSENRTQRTRAKEAEAKVAELQAKVTELEAAANELTTLKRQTLFTSIKTKHGLTDEQANFLKGETEEELNKSAEAIVEAFNIKPSRVYTPTATPLVGSTKPTVTNGRYIGGKYQPRTTR